MKSSDAISGSGVSGQNMYINGEYLDKNNTWHSEDSPWKAEQIYKLLLRNNVFPRSVCEIGCGAGAILTELSKRMPDTEFKGYELSPQAFELCKKRESERVQYFCKDLFSESDFYDCLLCIDVFEHVPDYFGFIKSLKSKANYNVFHIPLDISIRSILSGSMMQERKTVGHLHYFTKETAIATLKDCGYEIIDGFYTMSFLDMPSKTLRTKFAKWRYKILFSIFPNLTVSLLGSSSYIVLCR
jgi:SAM-dependent methyltransferase